jgi:acyl phosphate:glycerol-3-phosphate acyltransferase
MSGAAGLAAVVVVGYLLGSIPVAVLVGRRRGVDPRDVGDRNPGYWNAKEQLGRRAAVPVFVGDVAKGALAAGFALLLGPWWWGYVALFAAMVGHAWPVFARFRGGRSVLTFVGGVVVLSPWAALVCIGLCVGVTAVTRRFSYGARVAVFGFPVVQLAFDPVTHVAATGACMCLIGLRFFQAWRTSARATSAPGAAPPS